MGFVFDAREHRWQHEMLAALKCFKNEYGDFPIPDAFVVPTENPRWPANLWGKKIGSTYFAVVRRVDTYSARRRDELEEIGFPMDPSEDVWWNRVVLPALQTFKAKYGHVIVPQTFQVPEGDPSWPKRSWGWNLGFSVSNFRRDWEGMTDLKRQQLGSLGYLRFAYLDHWTKTLFPALQTFHKLHGHCRIHKDFRVPDQESQWPKTAWNLKLGKVFHRLRFNSRGPLATVDVNTLRELGCHVEVRAEGALESEDQVLQLTRRIWLDQVAPAVATFVQLHDHLDVPLDFQVPTDDDVWPKQSAGIQLGALVDQMTAYDRRKYYDLYTVDFPLRWE